MNDRIKILRESEKLNMEQFGNRLGVTRSAISRIEKGERNLTEQMILSICREFYVSEEWLRTGNGEMYKIAEDQTALIVSDLLKEDNPFYDIILEITKTYQQLDSKSKKVLQDFSKELLKNMKEGKE